jgi:PAS domain S-box-containing protein
MDQTPLFHDTQALELARAYKTLREYESILNILPDIIYKIDPEGHFVFISNSVSTLGFQPEELLGRHFSVLVHPEDVLKVSRKYVLPKYQGKTTGEDKAPKLFDEVRTGRRITRNLAVRLVPKFFPKAPDQATVPTVEGEVIASGIYGKLADEHNGEFEGTSGRISLKTSIDQEVKSAARPTPATEAPPRDYGNPKNDFQGTVGVIRDVSERNRDVSEKKLLRDKNHQLELQLFHSNKMQTLGELAGGIAHDFNNLLSIMLGQAELLLKRVEGADEASTQSVVTIQKTIIQAADLNSRLLSFARKVKIADLPIDLHETIMDTMHLLFHSFDKSIRFSKEFIDDPLMIMGDGGLLKNALINIALNARDAMPGGGQLIFKTGRVGHEALQGYFPEKNVPAGDYAVVIIQDTGIGMDPEVLDRIFEPFYTTKSLGRGNGLGLTCVDGIIDLHKGFIRAESGQNLGSTFTLYFPVSEQEPVPQIEESLEVQPSPLAKKRIMIVDDEEIVLETQSLILAELGFQVTPFSDSITAIEHYRQHYPHIDLVILDLNMPNLNGKQCFLELKKIFPPVKVVVSTGCNVDNEADELIKIGIAGLMQKPFPIKILRQTILDILENSPASL